jgi:hypothetical protein
MHDFTSEIKAAVRQLKAERDTWKAVALQYQHAFKTQTDRLQELQNICFATQTELENERAQHRRFETSSDVDHIDRPSIVDGAHDVYDLRCFGTAIVISHKKSGRTLESRTNPLFHRVQQALDQRNYGIALVEIERLLRGPLSPKARAEGLLLKSNILRAAGPDEVYDALAACSEALELCDRIADLETFLPQIQYQRGMLYYQLRMLYQARDAFRAIGDDDPLSATAKDFFRSCENGIGLQCAGNRRSGFDEDRWFDEGLLVKLDEKAEVWCIQLSRHLQPYLLALE